MCVLPTTGRPLDEHGQPGLLHALVTAEAISDEMRLQIVPYTLQRAL